jgi:nitrogenase iron protein NifH
MIKLAFYGKGGIGKSTTVSNLAVIWAERGHRVLQVGCDPKADSTILLRHGRELPTVMDSVRSGRPFGLDDVVCQGFAGVLCAEAGGPLPGLGCAGRGIITALETLEQKGVYERYQPDVVLFDVLGDVVCGGFAVPMREGYANYVLVVTSGENMSIHAAANIGVAVQNFQKRGYAQMGGLVLNRRDVRDEEAKVRELAGDLGCDIVGALPHSSLVTDAEEGGLTLMEAAPDSAMAEAYRALADSIERRCGFGAAVPAGEVPAC